jgi:GNAT superfamily N-acetyltransferase
MGSMDVDITPVQTQADLVKFVKFPWQIYRGDPNWVPPLVSEQLDRLDGQRSSFWKTAKRELWIAHSAGKPIGRIAAIVDSHRNQSLNQKLGTFGFFECVDDISVATRLLTTAEEWLRDQGMTSLRGPYNPTENEEPGILVDGFETRPAIMEGHTPRYYPALLEAAGYQRCQELVARLVIRPESARSSEDIIHEKLHLIETKVKERKDLVIRQVDLKNWEKDIQVASDIFNRALADLPENVPVTQAEFLALANSFKPFLDPRMAIMAEVSGKPVGFAIALPDINEALQHVDGQLNLLGLLKLWWYSRKMKRASFKILMMLPEYQNRGIEVLLVNAIARAFWDGGYEEMDMSMTGDNNPKSNRFQDHLGFQVYRRYWIYEKDL